MRIAAIIVLVITTAAHAAQAPCPSPTVKIKGPCPTEVKCSNLGDVHAVCAPCPAPAVINCPSPCPPLPVKECPPCDAPAPAPQAAPKPPQGVWGLPLTLGWLPAQRTSLTASQRIWEHSRSFEVDVDRAHSYVYGAGLSYQFPSRWQIMAQGVYVDSGDVSARLEAPAKAGYSKASYGAADVDSGGKRWGALVTVVVPLGGR